MDEYVIAYQHHEGGIRTMRKMSSSYGEVTCWLRMKGIGTYRVARIPGSATYSEQRDKVKAWLRMDLQETK
jgi:hypothetical protein